MSENEAKCALASFIASRLSEQKALWLDENGSRYGTQDGIQYMVEELLTFYNHCENDGETVAITWARNRLEELGKTVDISSRADRIEALKYVSNRY